MIVEIGTSDFRTKAGEVDGLFIEPVKSYFDRLPDCNKENIAISKQNWNCKSILFKSRRYRRIKITILGKGM